MITGLSINHYTDKDVDRSGRFPRIYIDTKDRVRCPLDWQRQGLQQTASGYGRKLTTQYKVFFMGKLRRLYATCFSNVASVWFIYKGSRIYVA